MEKDLVDVGNQRQLLFDDFFFDRRDNIKLTLHPPTPREVVLESDKPWESKGVHYSSVIFDQGKYRMWYRSDEGESPREDGKEKQLTCYAESSDGVAWEKPDLGIYSWNGSTGNNIVMSPEHGANPSVIIDPNLETGSGRYKMILRAGRIAGFVSEDGLNWDYQATVVDTGRFDSHNALLWDDESRKYVVYARDMPEWTGPRRSIRRGESSDFKNWSHFETLITPDGEDPPDLNIYTNAAVKYFRAARSFFMFPMILYTERQYPGTPYPGLSDVQFLSSRDGINWNRNFRQPFLSPGLDERNWVDRNPIMGIGIVPTGPTEISMYHSELLRSKESRFRRCSLRTDGFVSVEGPYTGWGEFTTRPLQFEGQRLELNYSTSGGGGIQVEIQNEDGEPFDGYGLSDCPVIFGDKIAGFVDWSGVERLDRLAGQAIRLRVRLRDAHLYAFRFA